ncbi:MAG TPA: type 4a pilus biogenesis protein PilO [Thermoanaerobaculia bacterium]|nr:type 4a pilus biogenesis protein PilO [Thermoanaerobaculia bacterium]
MALTLDDKPWWVGLLVGLGLAVAVLWLVDTYVVKDIKEEIAATETAIGDLDTKIRQGRAAEQKLPQFREEVKRLELELEKLRRILPSTRNTEEIIQKIKSLVDQGEFTLNRLSFPPLGEAGAGGTEAYVEWPIAVAVDGRYHDLAILFNRLGNFSRIMNVENIRINARTEQDNKTITSEFTAKTFVYVEPKEEVPAAEGAAAPGGAGGGEAKPGGNAATPVDG